MATRDQRVQQFVSRYNQVHRNTCPALNGPTLDKTAASHIDHSGLYAMDRERLEPELDEASGERIARSSEADPRTSNAAYPSKPSRHLTDECHRRSTTSASGLEYFEIIIGSLPRQTSKPRLFKKTSCRNRARARSRRWRQRQLRRLPHARDKESAPGGQRLYRR